MHKNSLKAKGGKAPLSYPECKRLVKESLGEGVTKYLGEEEQDCPYSGNTGEKDLRDENIMPRRDLFVANITIQKIGCPSEAAWYGCSRVRLLWSGEDGKQPLFFRLQVF